MDFVTQVYEATAAFPEDERQGLAADLRRAAVTVPANIAEGSARSTAKELRRFLYITLGGLAELETQLLVAANMAFLPSQERDSLLQLLAEIRKQVLNLIRSIKTGEIDE